jgi:hypothetical protein
MKFEIANRRIQARWCGAMAIMLVCGCDPANNSNPESLTARTSPVSPNGLRLVRHRDTDEQILLRQVFQRYGRSQTYSDSGELIATTIGGSGQVVSKAVAPMSLWLSQDRMYVRAYQARVWSDGRKLTGWIGSEETDNFDSQVLSLDVPAGRPQERTIVIDPVLASALGGGAGGPPPQLEWLFAESPMSGLFDGESQFEKGNEETIDQTMCQAIKVTNAGETFVFWIDIDRSLIRRIELPRMRVTDPVGKSPQDVRLILDLHDATFSDQTALPVFDPMPERPRFVKRLIPLPPNRPLENVPASIAMSKIRIDSKPDATRVGGETVFWMTHTSSAATKEWLQELRQVWSQENKGTIEIFEDKSIDEESLWIVDHRGNVHFDQSLVPPVVPDTMMAVTTDLATKINVRLRLIEQWEMQNKQYQDALKDVLVK